MVKRRTKLKHKIMLSCYVAWQNILRDIRVSNKFCHAAIMQATHALFTILVHSCACIGTFSARKEYS